jgi:hypothetical protein
MAPQQIPRVKYAPAHSLATDLQVVKAMWFPNIQGDSHQDQLESFYKSQVRACRARTEAAKQHQTTSRRVSQVRMGISRFHTSPDGSPVLFQAHLYDSYRCRMLHGREPMMASMPAKKGDIWVDLGGGTGSNLVSKPR